MVRGGKNFLNFDILLTYSSLNPEIQSFEIFDVFIYPLVEIFNSIELQIGEETTLSLRTEIFTDLKNVYGSSILTTMI